MILIRYFPPAILLFLISRMSEPPFWDFFRFLYTKMLNGWITQRKRCPKERAAEQERANERNNARHHTRTAAKGSRFYGNPKLICLVEDNVFQYLSGNVRTVSVLT